MAIVIRMRRSLTDIQADYDAGNTTELVTLMRAWKGIKELGHAELNSFFNLAGYHGEPFRGPGVTDPKWWGGYCQHGTVLFPSWHRVYLYQFEKALQSIPGCESVMLPFWDECSDYSRKEGIPRALTDEFFELDGKQIPNPLRSFVLPVEIKDPFEKHLYTKPAGYETVRYPLSGLVGTLGDQIQTEKHNKQFPNYANNVRLLDGNVIYWLTTEISVGEQKVRIYEQQFVDCLEAPNYTLFSNTTSTKYHNDEHPEDLVTALESPHNGMHIVVGGFDPPREGPMSKVRPVLIPGANGDMGENETASFDPIFFFHHSFCDYVFWTWQRRKGFTDSFEIDSTDPGAIYGSDDNPPPAGGDYSERMTMSTPLNPFKKSEEKVFTTADCINIETQLGYTYGPGSLDKYVKPQEASAQPNPTDDTVHVSGIDRSKIRGSFLISAYLTVDGEEQLIGWEAVLSRWHVEGCANCQNHLKCSADFRVPAGTDENAVRIEIQTRAGANAERVTCKMVIRR